LTFLDRTRRYGLAVLAILLGSVVLSIPILQGGGTPIIVFYLLVILSASYGGFGPGLLTTLLIVLCTWSPLVEPWQVVRLGLFIVSGLSISALAEVFHAARRRAEANRLRLRTVLNSIGDAVIAADSLGKVNFLNPVASHLTGWPLEEAAGRRLEEVYHIRVDEAAPGELVALEPGESKSRPVDTLNNSDQVILVARDGTETPIHQRAAPLRDSDGQEGGVVLVFRDDAVRRAHERDLRESNRRKDEFLAMLAHELRNPLAVIRQAVTLLGTPSAEAQANWARDILRRQVDHLRTLLDDLLDVSRYTQSGVVLHRSVIDIRPVIDRALEPVRHLIEARNHDFDCRIEAGTIWVDADPDRLEQVFTNLIDNAARYSEPNGIIIVSARAEGEDVAIRVEDNGRGLSPDLLPRVFDLFAQGERSLSRAEGGLGIGLTIVKSLVEQHGGRVQAESRGPGQGSVFTVILSAAEPPALSEPEPVRPSTAASSGARILIVEDNKDLAESTATLLRCLGNDVEMAFDGLEGIERARTYQPEVILLDIGLPYLDGYQVAQRLRQEQGLQDALIIGVSGYGQEEDRNRSKAAGMDYYMVKPLELGVIEGLISRPARDHAH
jgi:PAS domain S-box-containing protein